MILRYLKQLYNVTRCFLDTALNVAALVFVVLLNLCYFVQVHYKKLMKLVEEATERYQKIASRQTGGGSQETFSTTHDPQTSGSDHSSVGDGLEDDDSSVPDPRNGNVPSVSSTSVMNTPWKIFFQQTPHDITGSSSERAEHDRNDELQTHGRSSGEAMNQLTDQNSDVTTINHLTKKDDSSDVDINVNSGTKTLH